MVTVLANHHLAKSVLSSAAFSMQANGHRFKYTGSKIEQNFKTDAKGRAFKLNHTHKLCESANGTCQANDWVLLELLVPVGPGFLFSQTIND